MMNPSPVTRPPAIVAVIGFVGFFSDIEFEPIASLRGADVRRADRRL